MHTKNTKQGGFTLVEIAIVLVIIGLLLGGILKGQELINNAKVRSVADRQNSLKAAWFGFIDRYNFIPGDSKRARQLVPGADKERRNADDEAGNGRLTLGESVLAMQHLTGAGFLRCPQCDGGNGLGGDPDPGTNGPNAENSLINQYSGVMSIWNDHFFYSERDLGGTRPIASAGRLQIHSGPRIPSNILGEVDRKIDDGIANAGDMVYNLYDPSSTGGRALSPTASGSDVAVPTVDNLATRCTSVVVDLAYSTTGALYSAEENVWRTLDAEGGPVENNCGASVFI